MSKGLMIPIMIFAVILLSAGILLANNPYFLSIFIYTIVSCLVAISVRLLLLINLITLSSTAFMAVGGYTSALLTTMTHISVWYGLILAIITAIIISFSVGIPALKTKGVSFIVMTLALNEIVMLIVTHTKSLGGAAGIADIPALTIWGIQINTKIGNYYFASALFLIVLIFAFRLDQSRFGAIIKSIRENELVAEAMGINVKGYKLLLFVISSVICAIAGWFHAHYFGHIDPRFFSVHQSIYYLIMSQFGGVVSIIGPIVGSILLVVLPEFLRIAGGWEPVFFGIIIIVTMLFFPQGVVYLFMKLMSSAINIFKGK